MGNYDHKQILKTNSNLLDKTKDDAMKIDRVAIAEPIAEAQKKHKEEIKEAEKKDVLKSEEW